jgi:foldase protein PrsA
MTRNVRNLGCCGLLALAWLAGSPLIRAEPPSSQKQPATTPSGLPAYDKTIVAYVNGQAITRQDLADELIARKGRKHLEMLINRRIIEQAAQAAGVSVTDDEVDAELAKMVKFAHCQTATEFEQKVLKDPKRNTTLFEYREDVIRHGLLMRKLAGQKVAVTPDEVQRAFQARYGEKVKCRAIIATKREAAADFFGKIAAEERAGDNAATLSDEERASRRLDAFKRYAKQQADPGLASVEGDLEPIGRYSLLNSVDETAFKLRDGEMSGILEVPDGPSKAFMLLLRERLIPADGKAKLADVQDELREDLLERKMREEIPRLFQELRVKASVLDYLNNKMDLKEVLQLKPDDGDKRKSAPQGPSSAQKR